MIVWGLRNEEQGPVFCVRFVFEPFEKIRVWGETFCLSGNCMISVSHLDDEKLEV